MDQPDQQVTIFSEGNAPVWFENGMYYIQGEANEYFMAAREPKNGNIILPSIRIPRPGKRVHYDPTSGDHKVFLNEFKIMMK